MLVYYILTGGDHPYGDCPADIERNIALGRPRMASLTPQVNALLGSLLTFVPVNRPSVEDVLRSVGQRGVYTHRPPGDNQFREPGARGPWHIFTIAGRRVAYPFVERGRGGGGGWGGEWKGRGVEGGGVRGGGCGLGGGGGGLVEWVGIWPRDFVLINSKT